MPTPAPSEVQPVTTRRARRSRQVFADRGISQAFRRHSPTDHSFGRSQSSRAFQRVDRGPAPSLDQESPSAPTKLLGFDHYSRQQLIDSASLLQPLAADPHGVAGVVGVDGLIAASGQFIEQQGVAGAGHAGVRTRRPPWTVAGGVVRAEHGDRVHGRCATSQYPHGPSFAWPNPGPTEQRTDFKEGPGTTPLTGPLLNGIADRLRTCRDGSLRRVAGACQSAVHRARRRSMGACGSGPSRLSSSVV
jgi:hypothetical protein